MIRNEMIEEMIKFVESTPKEASEFHKMDMLLSRMQRLGMIAPDQYASLGEHRFEWEDKE